MCIRDRDRDRDDRISLCDSGTLHGTAHGTPYPAPPEALSDRAPRGARSSYPSCRPAGTRTASRCGLLTPTVSIAHYGCVATVVWYEWVCGTALRRDVVTASAVRPRNMTNARHEAGPLAERRPARRPCRHHVPDTRPTDGVQRTLLRSTGCNRPIRRSQRWRTYCTGQDHQWQRRPAQRPCRHLVPDTRR